METRLEAIEIEISKINNHIERTATRAAKNETDLEKLISVNQILEKRFDELKENINSTLDEWDDSINVKIHAMETRVTKSLVAYINETCLMKGKLMKGELQLNDERFSEIDKKLQEFQLVQDSLAKFIGNQSPEKKTRKTVPFEKPKVLTDAEVEEMKVLNLEPQTEKEKEEFYEKQGRGFLDEIVKAMETMMNDEVCKEKFTVIFEKIKPLVSGKSEKNEIQEKLLEQASESIISLAADMHNFSAMLHNIEISLEKAVVLPLAECNTKLDIIIGTELKSEPLTGDDKK